MKDYALDTTIQKWVKLTKILLRHTSRAELKNMIDSAADEIKHVTDENGDIIKEDLTHVEREYGETVKTLKNKVDNAGR